MKMVSSLLLKEAEPRWCRGGWRVGLKNAVAAGCNFPPIWLPTGKGRPTITFDLISFGPELRNIETTHIEEKRHFVVQQ